MADDSDLGFFPQTPDLFEEALCHDLYAACQAHQKEIGDWRRRIMNCQHIAFCHVMLTDRQEQGGREICGIVRGVHDLFDSLNPHSPSRWNLAYHDLVQRALSIGEFDWSRGWRSAYWQMCNALIAQDAICYWSLRVVRECPDSEHFYRSDDRSYLWFRHVFGLCKWVRGKES